MFSLTLTGSVLAAGTLLSGCAGDRFGERIGKETAGNDYFTVVVRHTQIKDTQKKRLALLQDVVRTVEEEVPGVRFELDGVEEAVNRFDKLRSEMATGNMPHIFDLFGGTDTKDYVRAGRLLELTPIIEELGLTGKFYALDEFIVGGKIYGLPMAGFVEGLYYNKKLFARFNLKPPQTWDELIVAAETFKANDITPFALASKDAWVINMMLNTMWVRMAGPDSVNGFVEGTRKWTDPDVLEAFRKYEQLVQRGFFPEASLSLAYAEQQKQFSIGQAAMLFDGSWANTPLVDWDQSKVAEDVGFINFPSMGGPGDHLINAGYSNGYGFRAKLNANELKAVKAFIKAMYTEPMQKRQLIEEGMVPAMKLTDTSGVKPIIAEILQANSEAEGVFPAFDSIIQPSVREALERGMQELLGGKSTAEEVAASVQKAQNEANKAVN